jgi:hypothetical protein
MSDMEDGWGRDTRASRLDQFEPTAPAPLITGMGSGFSAPSRAPRRSELNVASGAVRAVGLALAATAAWLVLS